MMTEKKMMPRNEIHDVQLVHVQNDPADVERNRQPRQAHAERHNGGNRSTAAGDVHGASRK